MIAFVPSPLQNISGSEATARALHQSCPSLPCQRACTALPYPPRTKMRLRLRSFCMRRLIAASRKLTSSPILQISHRIADRRDPREFRTCHVLIDLMMVKIVHGAALFAPARQLAGMSSILAGEYPTIDAAAYTSHCLPKADLPIYKEPH